MATATASAPTLPRSGRLGRPLGWWGVVFMIVTEAMIFALLLFAYFFVRANTGVWPPAGIKDPELVKSGIRTVILLGSSVPMHFAQKAIARGSGRVFHSLLTVTLLMGAVFLAGHVEEYLKIWKEYTFYENAYGSLFYSITTLHSLHLIVGMASAFYVLVLGLRGRYDEHNYLAVENTAMYWHFVDGVWIFVYSSLYLSVTLA